MSGGGGLGCFFLARPAASVNEGGLSHGKSKSFQQVRQRSLARRLVERTLPILGQPVALVVRRTFGIRTVVVQRPHVLARALGGQQPRWAVVRSLNRRTRSVVVIRTRLDRPLRLDPHLDRPLVVDGALVVSVEPCVFGTREVRRSQHEPAGRKQQHSSPPQQY
jgi:hypothetical protein